jgi:hypothetical protein
MPERKEFSISSLKGKNHLAALIRQLFASHGISLPLDSAVRSLACSNDVWIKAAVKRQKRDLAFFSAMAAKLTGFHYSPTASLT